MQSMPLQQTVFVVCVQACIVLLFVLALPAIAMASGCPDCGRQRDALAKIDWAAIELGCGLNNGSIFL